MSELMILLLIPFVASLIAFLYPQRTLMILLSVLPLGYLLFNHTSWIGTSFTTPWLTPLSIHFHLSVDALSLVFLYLTAFIIPIALLAGKVTTFPNVFYGLVFLLEGLLFTFFIARDLAVFTIFWEAMLLPLFFLINIWGGQHRHAAAMKFLIYMIAGSALMVAGVLALYFSSAEHTFDLDLLKQGSTWIFAVFLLAFAVKTPLFPFHAWLPDTYCQASTAGTILLAAILSKAGVYGILRIGMELFYPQMVEWSPCLLALAIVGVFYGGLAAWGQKDYKRLIAYSSFSHVNFILVGLFVLKPIGEWGAVLQAVNHAVTICALFLVAGWLEGRIGSTQIFHASGLAKALPQLCWLTLFFVLASVALPGTNNFVGELLIFYSLFITKWWLAMVLVLSVILSAIYMLRWMQKVYFESPNPGQHPLQDLTQRELLIALPLVLMILWIGLYPAPLIHLITTMEFVK